MFRVKFIVLWKHIVKKKYFYLKRLHKENDFKCLNLVLLVSKNRTYIRGMCVLFKNTISKHEVTMK